MRTILLCLVPALLAAGELKTDIEFVKRADVVLKLDSYILDPLVQAGFAWFSVNYRLSPGYTFPAHTDDVESAVEYIKTHAKEFKINPKRLVLTGASAGGHLVSFVGAHHRKGNDVAAVIPFFGEHDLVDRVHTKGPCMIDGKVVPDPGAQCELIRVEGGGHGFGAWDKDPAMAGYRQQMLDWLKRVLR